MMTFSNIKMMCSGSSSAHVNGRHCGQNKVMLNVFLILTCFILAWEEF